MKTYKFKASSFKQIGTFVKVCSKLGIRSLAVHPDKKMSKSSAVIITSKSELEDILSEILESDKDLIKVYETISYIGNYTGKKLR
jgi:hypothetical protein